MERGSPAAAPAGRRPTAGASRRVTLAAVADAATAQGLLLAALLRSRLRPTGRLVAPATDAGDAPDGRCVPEPNGAVVERAIRAIDRASRRGLFRPTCLVRSLALVRLLERWGVRGARIRIGVRRDGATGVGMVAREGGAGRTLMSGGDPRPPGVRGPTGPAAPTGPAPRARLRAHAWVEIGGRVIGDDPRHVARFSPLGSVTSTPLRWR